MVDGYIPFAAARSAQIDVLEGAMPAITEQVRSAANDGELSGPGPMLLGMGASLAAAGAAAWAMRSRGIDALRVDPGANPVPFPASDRPLIGISQSGRSAETLAVMDSSAPHRRLAVVNVVPSPVSNLASTTISLGNLHDSYASTIGYTATVIALGMLAEAWDGGEISQNWQSLPDHLRQVDLHLRERASALALPLVGAHSIDCVGAARSIGSAETGALMLREIARIPASGFSTRQYLHGAMESAGHTAHLLMGGERELGVARTLAQAGHDVILVTNLEVAEEPRMSVIRLPEVSAVQRPVLEALVVQALAAEAAARKGLDPDTFVFFHADTKVA